MPPAIPGAPMRCDSPYAGTPTGYRIHNDARRKDPSHKFCLACREAIRVNHERYRKMRILNGAKLSTGTRKLVGGMVMVDGTGTRRRLQGLFALGYSWEALGSKLGVSGNSLGFMTRKRDRPVFPETEQKIRALYDELSMLPPEESRSVKFARTFAKKSGYLPPLSWDDEVIDDPYGLPEGMSAYQAYVWFWACATISERIEYVLEHGLSVTRSPRDRMSKSQRQ